MEMPSSNCDPWFIELEDVDDQILLQEFVGDCLVDYPPEPLHYTLSASNSSTATVDINNTVPKYSDNSNSSSPDDTDNPQNPTTTKSAKRPRRLPGQCQSHIIAERQRRQNLSQCFIALSALIPGLKKMDKTSILGEAITHMKELKERLKILEVENVRRSVESVVVVQRSRVIVENESNSSTSNDSGYSGLTHDEVFPDVEVRFSNQSVLIKIHCQMRTGVLSTIFNQIEKLNLSITNSSSMPFDNTTLDITIMTQMGPDFNMRPQEVVANLRTIF